MCMFCDGLSYHGSTSGDVLDVTDGLFDVINPSPSTPAPSAPPAKSATTDKSVHGVGAHVVAATGDAAVDGLLFGYAWNGASLTYSFPTQSSFYGSSYGSGAGQYPDDEPFSGFSALTGQQQGEVSRALKLVADYTNLNFSPIAESASTHAVLRFSNSSVPATANARFPTNDGGANGNYYAVSSRMAGDVFFGGTGDNPVMGNFDSGNAVLHEIGHALGLKHGHDAGVYGALPLALDSQEYSLMTYRAYEGDSVSKTIETGPGSSAQTFMASDIAALQTMYGADYSMSGQNVTYSFSQVTGAMSVNGVSQGTPFNNHIFLTIWDQGANSTLDLSNFAEGAFADLKAGGVVRFSSMQLADLGYFSAEGPRAHLAEGNVFLAFDHEGDTRSNIDKIVTGPGDDVVYGNKVFNTFSLGAGNDLGVLGTAGGLAYGGTGGDTLVGGAGLDSLYGDDGNDWLYGQGGHDALNGGGGIDILSGGAGNDTLHGDAGFNYLYGDAGEDALFGDGAEDGDVNVLFGGDGADKLQGGLGTNYFYGGAGRDAMTGGGGLNIFIASGEADGDFIIGGAGQNYVYGSNGGDTIEGGAASDVFVLGAGDNVVRGGGGVDYIFGGAGRDSFMLEAADAGVMVIHGFEAGKDSLTLLSTAARSFSTLTSSISYQAGIDTTIITADNDSAIWLIGVKSVSAADILFA